MPCDQVRTTTLALEGANLTVMAKAFATLGFNVQVDEQSRTVRLTNRNGSGYWANGKMVFRGESGVTASQVARAYSTQSILETATRAGWQLAFQRSGEVVATRRKF